MVIDIDRYPLYGLYRLVIHFYFNKPVKEVLLITV
jgi:hypothetical protein